MRRLISGLVAVLLLCACTPSLDNLQTAARDKMHQLLANQFSRQMSKGINLVIDQLGTPGGYLDDPLVRILLPPPLGMAIGVARDLQADPQAALLETLINHAAEGAIPAAGPILQAVMANKTAFDPQHLMDAGETATTDYLKATARDTLKAALMPVVNEKLHADGAVELYGKLLAAHERATEIQTRVKDAGETIADIHNQQGEIQQAVSEEQLGDYVAEKAVDGLFKRIAVQEREIHHSLAELQTGGL